MTDPQPEERSVVLGSNARKRIVRALMEQRTEEWRRLGFDPRMEAERIADWAIKAVNE